MPLFVSPVVRVLVAVAVTGDGKTVLRAQGDEASDPFLGPNRKGQRVAARRVEHCGRAGTRGQHRVPACCQLPRGRRWGTSSVGGGVNEVSSSCSR